MLSLIWFILFFLSKRQTYFGSLRFIKKIDFTSFYLIHDTGCITFGWMDTLRDLNMDRLYYKQFRRQDLYIDIYSACGGTSVTLF